MGFIKNYVIPKVIVGLMIILIIIGSILAKSFIGEKQTSRPLVYVVVKCNVSGKGDVFWQTVKSGAKIAAMELGVDLVFDGPDNETKVDDQINILRDIIEIKPDAIVLAPCDYNKLTEIGKEIIDSNINLIMIDSEMNLSYEHSFIRTNNVEASRTLAKKLAQLIKYEGQVAIVSHVKGASTAFQRESGFREVIRNYQDINLIEQTWYCNASIDQAYQTANEIIKQYPDITAIFGTNELALGGVARAIEDLGLSDKVSVVGFDSNEELVEKIEKDIVDAIIVQRPFNMGYLGVKEAVESIAGKRTEIIDTGAVVITKNNLYTPENQKLLFPFKNKEH